MGVILSKWRLLQSARDRELWKKAAEIHVWPKTANFGPKSILFGSWHILPHKWSTMCQFLVSAQNRPIQAVQVVLTAVVP